MPEPGKMLAVDVRIELTLMFRDAMHRTPVGWKERLRIYVAIFKEALSLDLSEDQFHCNCFRCDIARARKRMMN